MALQGPSKQLLSTVLRARTKSSSSRALYRFASAIAVPKTSNLPEEAQSEIQVNYSVSVPLLDIPADLKPSTKHRYLIQILPRTRPRVTSYVRMPRV